MPLTGHVDRNISSASSANCAPVVPLTGHVDRNIQHGLYAGELVVVPLTGHVDRNELPVSKYCFELGGRAPHGARG